MSGSRRSLGSGRPFEEGNAAAEKHGAYAERRLGPVRDEILKRLNAIAPASEPADEPALRALAGQLARIELVHDWLHENGVVDEEGKLRSAVRELAAWENSARKLMAELGLTTASRSRLQLDLQRVVTLGELHAFLLQQAAEFDRRVVDVLGRVFDGKRPDRTVVVGAVRKAYSESLDAAAAALGAIEAGKAPDAA